MKLQEEEQTGNLLAENRVHGELKAVPAAGAHGRPGSASTLAANAGSLLRLCTTTAQFALRCEHGADPFDGAAGIVDGNLRNSWSDLQRSRATVSSGFNERPRTLL